jgi:hypothetical protein
LSQVVAARSRTEGFAWYTLAGSLATALGALAAGALTQSLQISWVQVDSYRAVVVVYACVGVALVFLFQRVTSASEASTAGHLSIGIGRSRGVVMKLSALFALDSFGGGFVVQSFAAYWFDLRFGVDPQTLGVLFFRRTYSPVFRRSSPLVSQTGSVWSTRWSSPTCRPTCC